MSVNPRFPDEFLQRMHNSLGEDFHDFLDALKESPPVSVRYHPRKSESFLANDTLEKVPWCELGRYLVERPSFTFDPLFHAGTYYVQEAGSMLIEPLLNNTILHKLNDPLVLDLCAAPGGKSTHILSLLDGRGTLVCNEVIPSRNKVLQHNISKWGYSNVVIIQNDATEIADSGIQFDMIVADVPCSGEGLFRKDPDACNEWSPVSPQSCAVRQKKILDKLLPALKPGGFLLYSTCTFAQEENDMQIEELVRDHGFEVQLPDTPEGIQQTQYGWQAYPHRVKSEGFWCTLLRKSHKDDRGADRLPVRNPTKLQRKKNLALDYLDHGHNHIAIELNGNEWIIPEQMESLIKILHGKARFRKVGLNAGIMKGKTFIPDIDIAWSVHCTRNTPSVSVDHDSAIRYLQGESLTLDSGSMDEFALVNYRSANLGWIKRSGNYWSNHYPKDYRIRSRRVPDG